jgi:hypothetical protein
MSAWLDIVKKHSKLNKGKSLKDILPFAKAEYDALKKSGKVLVKGLKKTNKNKHSRAKKTRKNKKQSKKHNKK